MTVEDLAEQIFQDRAEARRLAARDFAAQWKNASDAVRKDTFEKALRTYIAMDRVICAAEAHRIHSASADHRHQKNIRFLDQHGPSLVGNGATAMPSPSVAPLRRKVA